MHCQKIETLTIISRSNTKIPVLVARFQVSRLPQLAEHPFKDLEVLGSNPHIATNLFLLSFNDIGPLI